ncbi:MAG: CDP-alcohol phosphatidyltransferase family protein [Thermoplasmata archaeon]|nr:MAG: CDP-alcohol phosphatidyltransferase family protein [Thermoplasmata archaeon]
MLSAKYKKHFQKFFEPIARVFIKVNPNAITLIGLLWSFFTVLAFYIENLRLALLFLLLTSFCDALDGMVARLSDRVTKFGGYLDSVLDRYSDGMIFLGIMVYLREKYLLIFLAMMGSFMVSYTRAKAETWIDKCDVGVAERGERLLILIIATILANFGINIFIEAIALIVILTHITFIQRMLYTRRFIK